MAFFKYSGIRISGVASAVPTKVVRSEDFNGKFGAEKVADFIKMTGVREHRQTHEKQTASDLGFAAAEKLIAEKGIDRASIGLLVFGSQETDYIKPATACVLQKRLGLPRDCAALDVGLGCSAFVYCANVACSMMQSSDIGRALVIVAATPSKSIYPEDRSSVMLFGDAGAAVLFERTDSESEVCGQLYSEGKSYKAIITPAGGFRNMYASREAMAWPDGIERTLYDSNMNGITVFGFSISDVPKTMRKFIERTGKTPDDFDFYALHQPNKLINQQIAKSLKVSMDKMPLCLDRYGNTSSASIPLTLCDMFDGGGYGDGEKNALMCGFGVGLSWGMLSAGINPADVFPVIETDDYFAEGIINSPDDM